MAIYRTCFAVLSIAVFLSHLCPCAFALDKPNVIIFLVDDMGWTDGSALGSDYYETPNLQRLADEGMTFTQAYAQPLCSPSRVALMTGRYPARIGMHQAITGQSRPNPTLPEKPRLGDNVIWPESRSHLPLAETTIAEAVQLAGYQTWFLGKWHLGSNPKFWPSQQGFDETICVGGAGPSGGYFGPNQIPGLDPPSKEGEYICERLTKDACNLIRNHSEKPFLMVLSHFNVHSPYEAKQEDIDRFAAKRLPNSRHNNPVMAAMLWAMDASLGQVMQCVEDEGLADDTWVFFVSDNGGVHWENMKGNLAAQFPVPVTTNAPLRGGKACFYEGGVRVPMIVKQPKTVAKGTICDTPVHLVDFFPTIVSVTQSNADLSLVDGHSLLPLLTRSGDFPKRNLYCHFPRPRTLAETVGGSFVRSGDYKLIRHWFDLKNGGHKYELFNLAEDIGEEIDLAGQMPEMVKSMSEELDNWLAATNALIPQAIQNPRPASESAYTDKSDDDSPSKPKVWIYTDMSDPTLPGTNHRGTINDPDDVSAMAGYLLMANEFETLGIVVASTHRNEHRTTPNQADWANKLFGDAYRADLKQMNDRFGGYPNEFTFTQSSIKETAERFSEANDYHLLDDYATVKALLDQVNSLDEGEQINVLCWGSLTEPAILVSHCIATGQEKLLKRLRFIAHWTNSPLHQGSAEHPEQVANCAEDATACRYLKAQAKAGTITYYECGAIGQHGIVSGSPKGDEYFDRFRTSRLGTIFVEGKYVHGSVDHSDSATYWTLLGGWGVGLEDIASDGSNNAEVERKNEKAFFDSSKRIHDELLRRCNSL